MRKYLMISKNKVNNLRNFPVIVGLGFAGLITLNELRILLFGGKAPTETNEKKTQ